MHWHARHRETLSWSDRLADEIAAFLGSWRFIVVQTIAFTVWVIINTLTIFRAIQFDGPPYILFNLVMSAEAAFSAPLIMMSQNRQAERDRHQAEEDYRTNVEAKLEIETLQRELSRLETEKLDEIIRILKSVER